MKNPITAKQQSDLFDRIMTRYPGFSRKAEPDRGFADWEHDGMHDPPGNGRVYSRVEQRVIFDTTAPAANFRVQLDLLDRRGKTIAAVFIRTKDLPKKALNTANTTFKFRWDKYHQAYVVDFRSDSVRRWLARTGSVPQYIKTTPARPGRVILSSKLDPELVHRLLLVADFAGQCDHGSLRPRKPQEFHPPRTQSGAGQRRTADQRAGTDSGQCGRTLLPRVNESARES